MFRRVYVVLALTLIVGAALGASGVVAAVTPTATPRPRATVTAFPTAKFPPEVQALVDRDSKTECDQVGWNLTRTRVKSGKNEVTAACLDDGTGIIAGCTHADTLEENSIIGPPSNRMWIVCLMQAVNLNDRGDIFVSPMDFTLVDATNQMYQYDPGPLVEMPDYLTYGGSVPPLQRMKVNVAFEIPKQYDKPLRLEYRPTLSFDDEFLIIVIDSLPKLSTYESS